MPAAVAVVAVLVSWLSGGAATEAEGVIDQTSGMGPWGSAITIEYYELMGQSFVPSRPTLYGVDLGLDSTNACGAGPLTVRLREGTLGGPTLATTTRIIPQYADPHTVHVEHFEFPAPVAVTPGSTYVIMIDSNNCSHGIVAPPSGDPYPDGVFISRGVPCATGCDILFATCADGPGTPCSDPPVGGVTELARVAQPPAGAPLPAIAGAGAGVALTAGALWLARRRRREA